MRQRRLKMKNYTKKIITMLIAFAIILTGSWSNIKFSKAKLFNPDDFNPAADKDYLGYSFFTDNGISYRVDYGCTYKTFDDEAYGVTVKSINQIDNDGNLLELSRDRVLPATLDLSKKVHNDDENIDYTIKSIGGEEADAGKAFMTVGIFRAGNLDATFDPISGEYDYAVKLPDTVTKINDNAFNGANVNEVVIPESCESVGKNIFNVAIVKVFVMNPNTVFADDLDYTNTVVGYNNSALGNSENKPSNFKSFEEYKEENGSLPSECNNVSKKEPIKLNLSTKDNDLYTGNTAKLLGDSTVYIIGNTVTTKGAKTVDSDNHENYKFNGYYTEDGTKIFDENGNFVANSSLLTNNMTVYANFIPRLYTVGYYNCDDSNLGEVLFDENSKYYYTGTTYTYGIDYTLATPTKTGYSFVNWTDDAGNTVEKITAGTNHSVYITGNWKANDYTVTLNSDGDTIDTISHTYASDSVNLPTPTRKGYTFKGWKDSNGNIITSIDRYLAENVTYTAQWESDTPVIPPTTNTEPTPAVPSATPTNSGGSTSGGSSSGGSSSGSDIITTPTNTPSTTSTAEPSVEPTENPTENPTTVPTAEPTIAPTIKPTATPTNNMGGEVITKPTVSPTATVEPTAVPTKKPSVEPTIEPNAVPTEKPNIQPTKKPIKYSKNSVLAKKKTTVGGITVTRKKVAANKKSAKVRFSWKKVKNADRYVSYVKDGKKWKKVKISKKNSFIKTIKKNQNYKIVAQDKVSVKVKGKKKYICKNIKTLKRMVKFK